MVAYDSKAHTTWQLARLAECADPDSHDGIGFDTPRDDTAAGSPGAEFLALDRL